MQMHILGQDEGNGGNGGMTLDEYAQALLAKGHADCFPLTATIVDVKLLFIYTIAIHAWALVIHM